jgi:small subunit ribosomal protein S1
MSSTTNKSITMADLLAKHKTTFVKVNKGEILQAVITKLNTSEILVDIGAKTEALVLEKDKKILRSLLSSLKVGDKVTVSVLNPESDYGNPVVSLRRFNESRVWVRLENLLKTKEQVEVNVEESTKGGFLVATKDGISGFLPNSQTVFLENSGNLVGHTIKVLIIELNKPLKKVIFSQKATASSADFDKAVKSLKIGQKVEATIANIAPFGIFTTINVDKDNIVEGFVHISELSWEKVAVIPDTFKANDKIEVQIVNLDRDAKRVNLSIKKLVKDPFEEKLKAYKLDQKVTGIVSKVISSGVVVGLDDGVEGFIKKDKIPPTMTLKEGSSVNTTVSEVDVRKHRVVLIPVLTEKPLMYR